MEYDQPPDGLTDSDGSMGVTGVVTGGVTTGVVVVAVVTVGAVTTVLVAAAAWLFPVVPPAWTAVVISATVGALAGARDPAATA